MTASKSFHDAHIKSAPVEVTDFVTVSMTALSEKCYPCSPLPLSEEMKVRKCKYSGLIRQSNQNLQHDLWSLNCDAWHYHA